MSINAFHNLIWITRNQSKTLVQNIYLKIVQAGLKQFGQINHDNKSFDDLVLND